MLSQSKRDLHSFTFESRPCVAMTNIIESEAYFMRRIEEAGTSDASRANLRTHGLTTLGKLAFACGQPGTPTPDDVFERFANATLGAMASI